MSFQIFLGQPGALGPLTMSACDADFQPNEAPPLSSVAVAAAGDVMTPKGSFPHTTPKALDKAGIDKVCTQFSSLTPNASFSPFV